MAAPTAFSRILGNGCVLRVGTGTATASSKDIISNDDITGGNIEGEATLVTAAANGENFAEHASVLESYTVNLTRMCTTGYPGAAKQGDLVVVTILDDQSTPQTILKAAAIVQNTRIAEFEKEAVVVEELTMLSHGTPTTLPAT